MISHDNVTTPRANDPGQAAILSRRQAAAYFGVSLRTFDRMQKEAAIPFVVVGRRRKYLQRDLEAYLLSQRSV